MCEGVYCTIQRWSCNITNCATYRNLYSPGSSIVTIINYVNIINYGLNLKLSHSVWRWVKYFSFMCNTNWKFDNSRNCATYSTTWNPNCNIGWMVSLMIRCVPKDAPFPPHLDIHYRLSHSVRRCYVAVTVHWHTNRANRNCKLSYCMVWTSRFTQYAKVSHRGRVIAHLNFNLVHHTLT